MVCQKSKLIQNVAVAEPEADPQYLVNPYVGYTHPVVQHPYVYTAPVVKAPVVKYVDPHHTEGMTAAGVPEKTDSVKLAEAFHKTAAVHADALAKVKPYVLPYHYTTPYAYGYHHALGKREAEADPQLLYSGYHYPYATTGVAGYHLPYTYTGAVVPKVAHKVAYTTPYAYVPTGAHATYPVVHHLGKREAEADPYYYYNTYHPYTTTYGYGYHGYPYHYGTYYG
jgi:hypothetical protein